MENTPLDPLSVESLIPNNAFWSQTESTNINFLSSVFNLAQHSKYFTLGRPSGSNWGDSFSSLIDVNDFAEGKLKGDMGLWLNAGSLNPEPIARWSGSTFPKRNLLNKDLIQMRQSGSIVMAPYFMGQIDKQLNSYFKAKDKLMLSNPDHPALKFAPEDIKRVDKAQLLWLMFWNISMQKRESRSFIVKNMNMNFANRIPLASMEMPLDKKVLFSEMEILKGEEIVKHLSLPNEWICNIYDRNSLFLNRDMGWAMPETPPYY
jgi:hypothetical protein